MSTAPTGSASSLASSLMSSLTSTGSAGATSSSSAAATPGGQMGEKQFLQLLVAQLQHQDPLDPTNPQDLAAQLAQFSSVEQLINVNSKLDAQTQASSALQQVMDQSVALGMIGKQIMAAQDKIQIPSAAGTVGIQLGGSGSATLTLVDANGNKVASTDLGTLAAGRYTVPLPQGANTLTPGTYRLVLNVTDSSGKAVSSQVLTPLTVSGIRYGSNGPMLVAGGIDVPLSSVTEVSSNP